MDRIASEILGGTLGSLMNKSLARNEGGGAIHESPLPTVSHGVDAARPDRQFDHCQRVPGERVAQGRL